MRRCDEDGPPQETLLGGAAGRRLLLVGALHGGALGDKLGVAGAVTLSVCLGASLVRLGCWLGQR